MEADTHNVSEAAGRDVQSLPQMVDMIKPAKGQVYKIGSTLFKIEDALPFRLLVREGRVTHGNGSVEWSDIEISTRTALHGADLIAGPGSRHALKKM